MADFSTVEEKDCVVRALAKGETLSACRTLVLQSVLNDIKEHGRSSMHKEVCGVLVGNLCWDKKAGAYLLIDARIEGKFADHQAGSVTFTSETWDYIHGELGEHHAEKRIVGWYHTHPGFGIFLSNMDVFIHENFFGLVWQPAYVFDPQAETDGFFFWKGSELEQEQVTIIPDAAPVVREVKAQAGDKILVTLTDDEERHAQGKKLRLLALLGALLALLLLEGGTLVYFYQETRRLERRCQQLEEVNRIQQEDCERKQDIIIRIHHETEEEVNCLDQRQKSQGEQLETMTKRQHGMEKENERQKKDMSCIREDMTQLKGLGKKREEDLVSMKEQVAADRRQVAKLSVKVETAEQSVDRIERRVECLEQGQETADRRPDKSEQQVVAQEAVAEAHGPATSSSVAPSPCSEKVSPEAAESSAEEDSVADEEGDEEAEEEPWWYIFLPWTWFE